MTYRGDRGEGGGIGGLVGRALRSKACFQGWSVCDADSKALGWMALGQCTLRHWDFSRGRGRWAAVSSRDD